MLLVIRADATDKIGMGHVTRQCDLAAELLIQHDVRSLIVTRSSQDITSFILSRSRSECITLQPEQETDDDFYEVLGKADADGIMLDLISQETVEDMLPTLRKIPIPVFSVTDEHTQQTVPVNVQFCCNPGQNDSWYADDTETKRYTGLSYALLHPGFSVDRDEQRIYKEKAENVLVLFGGVRSAEALQKISALFPLSKEIKECTIVVSRLDQESGQFGQGYQQSAPKVRVVSGLSPEALCVLMQDVDLMIGSCGNAAYEACVIGLPLICVNQVALQGENAATLAAQGACINLGQLEDVCAEQIAKLVTELATNRQRRQEMGKQAMALIDGKGISRIGDIVYDTINRWNSPRI